MPKNIIPIVILLVLLGSLARIFPHPANFAPIGAISLFSGLYLSKRLAFALPIIAMLVSDILIGFYNWKMMSAVYFSFLIIVYIGILVKRNKKITTILYGTLLGSIIFYLITNTAVWIFGTMYPHTVNGLMSSYIMGIPFFKNTIIGDLFFVSILVGSMEAIIIMKTKLTNSKVRI